jgi:hypothetical protein
LRGPLQSYAREVLSTDRVEATGVVSPSYAKHLLDSHVKGSADYTRELTCLISFVLWWNNVKPQTAGF